MNSLKVSHSIFTIDCDLCIFWMRSRIQDSDLGRGCRFFLQLISNSRSRPIPRCVYKLGYATHVTRNVQKHEILSLSLTLRLYRMTFGNETATCFWRFRSCAVCLSVCQQPRKLRPRCGDTNNDTTTDIRSRNIEYSSFTNRVLP